MSFDDYDQILARNPRRFYTTEDIARIWNEEHPNDQRSEKTIFNALKRRGRPDVIWVFRDGKRQFKQGQAWKAGMCTHCYDPVETNRRLCKRCV